VQTSSTHFIRKHALQLQILRQNGHSAENSASDKEGYLLTKTYKKFEHKKDKK
jgi:hypothetical protein